MSVRTIRALAAVALVALVTVATACDGGDDSSAGESTSTRSSGTVRTSTTLPSGGSSTTGTTPPTAATSTTASSSVRISDFRGPTSPVDCNAQTMVELSWTTTGAATVEMHIDDGGVFATYENGPHVELLPLPCDGEAHTYRLVAQAGSATSSASVTVSTQLPS